MRAQLQSQLRATLAPERPRCVCAAPVLRERTLICRHMPSAAAASPLTMCVPCSELKASDAAAHINWESLGFGVEHTAPVRLAPPACSDLHCQCPLVLVFAAIGRLAAWPDSSVFRCRSCSGRRTQLRAAGRGAWSPTGRWSCCPAHRRVLTFRAARNIASLLRHTDTLGAGGPANRTVYGFSKSQSLMLSMICAGAELWPERV